MAIPRNIFQTFKTGRLPVLTQWHVQRLRKQNPEYTYHYYDDERILSFLKAEYPAEVWKAFQRLTVGAAKADFFRYAALYRMGGVYLDLDAYARKPFSAFIQPDDVAVISLENLPTRLFAQWALIFDKGHPFLQKTLELILENIRQCRHLHDVHALTGPTVYTRAIRQCLQQPGIVYRQLPPDYNDFLVAKYRFNKFFLYKSRAEHWKKAQAERPVVVPETPVDPAE